MAGDVLERISQDRKAREQTLDLITDSIFDIENIEDLEKFLK